jgi:hypothetical protein
MIKSKVEMFWINEPLAQSEAVINEWLSNNQNVEIKHILQCADGAGDPALVSIWYTESSQDMIIISRDNLWSKLQDCGVSISVFNAMFGKEG